MKFRKNLGLTMLSAFSLTSQAATYFVDSELGNDSLSGQSSTISGTNGPWQSLAKVATTKLAPGDIVLLSCDRTWNETLTINQSGTAEAPIKIGPADQNCINPPTVSGLQAIPNYAWQQHGNGIWKVQFPFSLVRNGLLNEGNKYWRIWSPSNDATISNSVSTCITGKTAPCLNADTNNSTSLLSSSPFTLEKGATYNVSFSSLLSQDSNVTKWSVWSPAQDLAIQPSVACLANQAGSCLTVVSNSSVGLLSSNSFSVTKGQSYTLTFSAYIPTGKTAKVIVRQASGAYSTVGLTTAISGTGTWKNYTYTFNATSTEVAARLDFEIPTVSTIQFQKVKLNIPMTPMKTFVRQNGGSYQNLGLAATANNLDGVWKDTTYSFTASGSSANARLDFEVPAHSIAQFQKIIVNKVQDNPSVSQFLDNDLQQPLAHHPNKGFDSANPNSMFFKTATTSPTVLDSSGNKGSSYFTTGSDMVLPAGGSIAPGTKTTVRNHGFTMTDVEIASIVGNKINITPITSSPLWWTGLGYYFTDELWMLDSAGEWYFDDSIQTLYYYPSTNIPSNDIKFATNKIGVTLSKQNFIQLEGIRLSGLDTGIDATMTTNVTLSNLDISHVKEVGVLGHAADTLTLQDSNLSRIGQEGIFARNSDNVSVTNNSFDQIGLALDAKGNIVSNPNTLNGVIVLRNNANVSKNNIQNFGYVGINTWKNSTIQNNYLANGCLVLNDCGAIYVDANSTGTVIKGNLISNLAGDVNGLPVPPFGRHTAGIYSDNGANGNIIDGNTITNADFGIQLHDSYNQQVLNNLVFGSKRIEFWIQETSKSRTSTGDIHNIVVSGNKFFPTIPSGYMKLSSSATPTSDFGIFDNDIFSNYYGSSVVNESYGTGVNYTLSEWQAATINGVSRNLEPNGKINAPLGNYALGLLQSNIVPNANFQDGVTNWSRFGTNGTGPAWTLTNCTPQQSTVACIKVDASTVSGNLSTPKFNILKDHDYFLSFDILSSDPTQVISALVRQAGPTYWNNLMSIPLSGTQGTTGWKRYSVIFTATADAKTDGSVTGVSGARIDFTGIKAGQSISLANLELVPVGQQVELKKDATIISNPSFVTKSYGCPSNDSFVCKNYIDFATASKVNWPISLPALGSAVVYTQNLDYPDFDQDGIPNSQDQCTSTPTGATVNSKGCELK